MKDALAACAAAARGVLGVGRCWPVLAGVGRCWVVCAMQLLKDGGHSRVRVAGFVRGAAAVLMSGIAVWGWCPVGSDIDVLVSNVAVSPHFGAFMETTDDAWTKLFDINIKAAFFLTKVPCRPCAVLALRACAPAARACSSPMKSRVRAVREQEALPYLRFGSNILYVSSMGGYEPNPMIGG